MRHHCWKASVRLRLCIGEVQEISLEKLGTHLTPDDRYLLCGKKNVIVCLELEFSIMQILLLWYLKSVMTFLFTF